MIYVQQQPQQSVRSRKRPLVPLNMDNEIKIEFVNFDGMDIDELGQFGDSASNDSLSTTNTADYIEVVTATTAEEEAEEDEHDHEDDHDGSSDNSSNNGTTPVHRPRKRAKLDHLSVEQKAQHRKMMNRISAQSARDRQRALMQQQEENIATLTAKNSMLQQENSKLKVANEKLVEECRKNDGVKQENAKLNSLVAELEKKLKVFEFQSTEVNHLEKGTVGASNCSTLEPAVLDTCPLLKGQSLQQTSSAALLLMLTFLHWISTPQKFSELLRTSPHKSSDKTQTPNLASISHLIPKHLIHQLHHLQTKIKMQQMETTKLKPPD